MSHTGVLSPLLSLDIDIMAQIAQNSFWSDRYDESAESDAIVVRQFGEISQFLSVSDQTVDFSVVLCSRRGAWSDYSSSITGVMNRFGWPKEDIFSAEMSIAEAIINGMKHGNRYDEAKRVRVACRISPELLVIAVADEGDGFAVSEVADPTREAQLTRLSGRGLFIIRQYMSQVLHNETGNEMIMLKQRSPVGPHST